MEDKLDAKVKWRWCLGYSRQGGSSVDFKAKQQPERHQKKAFDWFQSQRTKPLMPQSIWLNWKIYEKKTVCVDEPVLLPFLFGTKEIFSKYLLHFYAVWLHLMHPIYGIFCFDVIVTEIWCKFHARTCVIKMQDNKIYTLYLLEKINKILWYLAAIHIFLLK